MIVAGSYMYKLPWTIIYQIAMRVCRASSTILENVWSAEIV